MRSVMLRFFLHKFYIDFIFLRYQILQGRHNIKLENIYAFLRMKEKKYDSYMELCK